MTQHHAQSVKILAFVGLTGSGKSSAVDYMSEKGFPKVYFGGIVLDEVRRRGLDLTQENEQPVREELRATEGKDFVVKRIITQINDLIDAGQHHIIADGIYSWTEYKSMKHAFPGELTVVAIVTPKHLRKQRMAKRVLRPLTSEQVDLRDWAEIENIEKGGPIAIADYFIHNEGNLDKLHEQIEKLLDETHFAQ